MKILLFVKNLILDAVFPHKCVCGKFGYSLCDSCVQKIKINKVELCPVCKKISKNSKTCNSCRNNSGLTGVMILASHEGVIKDAIWNLKYNFIRDLALPLTGLLHKRFGAFLKEKRFVLTAVPISKKRLKWRGYNQADLMAKELARSCGLKYLNILSKSDDVIPQVGLSKKERIQNIGNKISLLSDINANEIANKRILIVDDVYTTGSTLEECAKVLRKAGFKEVWGIVLSRD
jgi:ComF family protein